MAGPYACAIQRIGIRHTQTARYFIAISTSMDMGKIYFVEKKKKVFGSNRIDFGQSRIFSEPSFRSETNSFIQLLRLWSRKNTTCGEMFGQYLVCCHLVYTGMHCVDYQCIFIG